MLNTPGVRPPLQARSQRTLERILDAGAEVFAERGYDGLTITEVCRVAGISAGTLYTRFDSKDALVRAVHDHVMADMLAAVVAMYREGAEWDELPTPQFVERAVRLLADHFRAHDAIVRAIVLRAAVDPVMRESGARSVTRMADAFTARLLERAADYSHPDPELAVRTAFGMAFEAISWDVAFGAEFRAGGALGSPPDERLPSVCRMVLLTPSG
ncbi:TetR/AcrR family transcriptional regulator [Microbacterium sp. LWH3-1.2]|uniref:TetR/AcrR family transcriptional regulator n=1 Tax=Microbacterium sp. LWH3-1.2 TaxID=3135256 RepID=UPI00342F1A9B